MNNYVKLGLGLGVVGLGVVGLGVVGLGVVGLGTTVAIKTHKNFKNQ